MNPSLFLVILVLVVFAWAWYSASKLQNQIHCSYRRVDKTVIEKFTHRRSKHVRFDGQEYNIVPDRILLIRWKRGIHQFLPIWVQHLDFTWDYPYPLNPNDYKSPIISPEVRNAINQEERMKAYARSQQQALGSKKGGMLQQYLPYIIIIGFVILGFWLYTQGQHISMLENLQKVK